MLASESGNRPGKAGLLTFVLACVGCNLFDSDGQISLKMVYRKQKFLLDYC